MREGWMLRSGILADEYPLSTQALRTRAAVANDIEASR